MTGHDDTTMRRRLLSVLGVCVITLLSALPAHGQSTGTLMPNVPGQFLDNNGDPCNLCLLYSYTAGTSTPLSTYSDSSLAPASANTNPIVLNSAGRNPAGGIYLSAASYKFVLKTSAAATLWTLDNVAAVPYTTIASAFNSICDGRLTLTTLTPVTTADVTAATTVRFTPYQGNRCALYDGAQWNLSTFTELSIALGIDAANTNYDVFIYLSSGTATLERVAWTNDTTRATSIVLQDGVYVKSSATSRRYVGTYRTTAAIGQTEDSFAKRFVWNYLHRVRRAVRVNEATASWAYTTGTYRQANAAVGNQIAVVIGVAEVTLDLRVDSTASNTNTGVNINVSIGEDSTTTPMTGVHMQVVTTAIANGFIPLSAQAVRFPAIGYHYYVWLEISAATGTTTWAGAGGSSLQSGIQGFVEG